MSAAAAAGENRQWQSTISRMSGASAARTAAIRARPSPAERS
jgi:hypothetical protein